MSTEKQKNEYEPILDFQHRNELRARYDYLKHGGEWQKQTALDLRDRYLASFADAMRILGMLP